MPSIVSTADGRHSSSPVVSVKVSASKISSSGSRPCSSQISSLMRWAISSLRSRVLAIPTSSMVSAMIAAPCRVASGSDGVELVAPGLEVDRVDDRAARGLLQGRASSRRARWSRSGSARAGTSDTRLTSWRICSSSSWRSVSATQRSSTCAPPSTWSVGDLQQAVVVVGQQQLLGLAASPAS